MGSGEWGMGNGEWGNKGLKPLVLGGDLWIASVPNLSDHGYTNLNSKRTSSCFALQNYVTSDYFS